MTARRSLPSLAQRESITSAQRPQRSEDLELTFLGTRGEIDVRSRLHRRHSSLLVRSAGCRLMIDCGADWLDRVKRIAPTAILITHAHPDHAWGLSDGAPCPVYATRQTHRLLADCAIRERKILSPRTPIEIGGLGVQTIPVVHSIRAPAVGYRISNGAGSFFYVPDVVSIPARKRALCGARLYIGDGASLKRPLIRRRGQTLIGHSPIATQLGWCAKEGVEHAIFTHCGTEIVRGDGRKFQAEVRRLGRARNVHAAIAHDGLRISLGTRPGAPQSLI